MTDEHLARARLQDATIVEVVHRIDYGQPDRLELWLDSGVCVTISAPRLWLTTTGSGSEPAGPDAPHAAA